jgi:hypothetical protein
MDLVFFPYKFLGIFLYGYMLFMNKHKELYWLLHSTEKIIFKCEELYIGVDGSTLKILESFLQVQHLTTTR